MNLESEKKIKELTKKMLISRILSMPGAIMVGLAIYAFTTPREKLFFELLADKGFVYALLAVGSVIMFFDYKQQVKLSKERSRLKSEKST